MSVQVAKIKGIPVRLHFTLIIAIALISFTLASDFMPSLFPGLTTADYWVIGVVGAVIMFLSVLLHELAHSIVAQRYGVKVREIVLFVFGGVSDISEELKDYRKEMKMAAAGPVASFIIAGIFALSWFLVVVMSSMPIGNSSNNAEAPPKSLLIPILYYGAVLNVGLGAFNLIPAFPSDGGRILRSALVRRKRDYNEATRSAANVGIIISYGFMALGFITLFSGNIISGIWIMLLGWFLKSGAESYIAQIRLSSILSKIRLGSIMNTNVIAVGPELTGDTLLAEYFNKYMKSSFPVVDEKNRLLGAVTLAKIASYYPEQALKEQRARNIMIPRNDLIVMDADMTAEDAAIQMSKRRMGKIFVCRKESDELVGIISKTDLLNVETERNEIIKSIRKGHHLSHNQEDAPV